MFTVGMPVTTHPIRPLDKNERSRRGVIARPGLWFSRVQIAGEVLTFWNFELEPVIE